MACGEDGSGAIVTTVGIWGASRLECEGAHRERCGKSGEVMGRNVGMLIERGAGRVGE